MNTISSDTTYLNSNMGSFGSHAVTLYENYQSAILTGSTLKTVKLVRDGSIWLFGGVQAPYCTACYYGGLACVIVFKGYSVKHRLAFPISYSVEGVYKSSYPWYCRWSTYFHVCSYINVKSYSFLRPTQTNHHHHLSRNISHWETDWPCPSEPLNTLLGNYQLKVIK